MSAAPDRPRVVFEDPDLPHQIVIRMGRGNSHLLIVSCNCMRTEGGSYEPLEVRARWEAAEAIAVWRAHMEEAGEPAA